MGDVSFFIAVFAEGRKAQPLIQAHVAFALRLEAAAQALRREIGDPLPCCQQDAPFPLRVKGRDVGKPEWDRWETLRDGSWVAYEEPGRAP